MNLRPLFVPFLLSTLLPACEAGDSAPGDAEGSTSSAAGDGTTEDDTDTEDEAFEACVYPDRSDGCRGVSCASTPHHTELLTALQARIDASSVSDHVEIVDVYADEGVTVGEGIRVVFHVHDDWLSMYPSVSFWIEAETIGDEDRSRWSVTLDEQLLEGVTSVAPISEVREAVESCDPDAVFDRCTHMRFSVGPEVVFFDDDEGCTELIGVDAVTAELETCEREADPNGCSATG